MGIRYKVKVINAPDGLRIRTGAGTNYSIVGKLTNHTELIVIQMKELSNGDQWYKLEDGRGWCCGWRASVRGDYLRVEKDLTDKTGSQNANQTNNAGDKKQPTQSIDPNALPNYAPVSPHKGTTSYNIPPESKTTGVYESVPINHNITNKYGYPKKVGERRGDPIYDYSMKYDDKVLDALQAVKRNLNVPSAFSKKEIVDNIFTKFNRFRVAFPDIEMVNTVPMVFFTRPDLNLVDDNMKLHEQANNDGRMYHIYKSNPKIITSLTSGFSKLHYFNPLLSNFADSLEVMDESVDTLETGETFSGYKILYSKHNIKSITAGTMSIKFRDIYNLAITKQMQVMIDYQSKVYKGLMLPKTQYIYDKVIDYAFNVYYFLLDRDMETIRFWTVYYGVFPINVPKSPLSYDRGSSVSLPELSVSFAYYHREDLNPLALTEFNDLGNGKGNGYKYSELYNSKIASVGPTWVGVPFIESYKSHLGEELFRLRFRPENIS